MDAGKCNAPCNPDHASCLLTTCCGSRDGQLFTVSFTGRQNILLQVLRQLAFDYRTSAPTFRRRIEGSFVDSSALQVVNSNTEHSTLVAGRPCWGSTTNAASNAWFQDACYSLHWASRVNYADAERQCQEENHDARVAVPASAEENQFVTRLQCGCQGWLGIDTAAIGSPDADHQPQHYQNWTASTAVSQAGPCAQLRADGAWVKRPCTQHEGLLTDDADDENGGDYVAGAAKTHQGGNCFVCKRSRRRGDDKTVTLAASSASPSDTWRLECVADGDHPNELMVRMRHDPTGNYLACNSDDGGLHVVGPSEVGTATFVAVVSEEDGSFTLRQQSHYVALLDNNNLACLDAGKEEEQRHFGATASPSAAVFKPTCMLRILAARFLRLSIVTLSNDLGHRGRRECSVAVYDTTPSTASFRCRPAPLPAGSGPTAGDELWLEQQALLVSDQSRCLQPRTPLPFGRLRCINEHPRQSAVCTLAYGQGFTVARALTIDWNYIIFDTITVRANIQAALQNRFRYQGFAGTGDEDGNESELTWAATKEWANDFTVVFNNINEIAVVYAYVETRNWQMTLLALPLTTHTVQFWLEVVMLRYRWRALFQARGSFRVMYFEQPIGAQHDVGDVSNYDDIFFYIFGRYDFPVDASLIITLDNMEERKWPVALPTTSVVEEGAGVRQRGRPTGFPR